MSILPCRRYLKSVSYTHLDVYKRQVLTSLYLANGVFNNAMVKFDYDRDKFTSVMQGLTLTITGSIFIVFLFFQGLWERVLGLSSTIIILMFIEMLVTPALSFWSGRQRFEYQYKKLVTVTLIQSIANPVLGLIAVSLSRDVYKRQLIKFGLLLCLGMKMN